jgi:predicted AAA+ superfamily ATPase
MLKRKIEERIAAFAKAARGHALLIDGARQVGKTFIIEECGRRFFDVIVKLDFVKSKEAREIFENSGDEQDILTRLSAFSKKRLVPGKTLFFFDEIQKCPEAVTFIKYLVQDGRFSYILSGSLLGIELKNVRSVPVGFLEEAKMYPLDFEEFLWANGEQPELLEAASKAWIERRPLAKFYHDRLMRLFRLYLVTGGMPEAVQTYVDTKDIRAVIGVQKTILANYRRDISQYSEDEALRIRAVFDRIAPELSDRNKRFYSSSVKPGERFERLEDAYLWLIEAGVAIPSYCVGEPKIPLMLSEKPRLFKLFMNDVGLLAATYMNGIQLKILNGETTMNFGAVFENAVAQEMTAHGFRPNYYNSAKHGEVDFIVEKNGKVLPIEVKCGKHYERHHALSHLLAESLEYGIDEAIVFDADSFKAKGNISYLPIYMSMFLVNDDLPEQMIYDLRSPEVST